MKQIGIRRIAALSGVVAVAAAFAAFSACSQTSQSPSGSPGGNTTPGATDPTTGGSSNGDPSAGGSASGGSTDTTPTPGAGGGAEGGTPTTPPGGSTTDGAAPPTNPPTSGAALKFVVYGDSRTNVADHQSVVDAFAKWNPQLVIDTGDLWDGYGPDKWKTIITKNSNVGALLNSNMFLVSRGNHEPATDLLAVTPTLVRNGKELYSAVVGNSFFVSLGMDPKDQGVFLETELSSAAAKGATWRFVYSHYPIYSGGTHGAKGIPAIEALCDKYNVTAYMSGHDHIYERSQQMFASKVVDTGNVLTGSKGTVYIVAGGGGAPRYPVTKIASTHFSLSTLNYVTIDAQAKLLTATSYSPNGKVIDTFTVAR